MSAFLDALRKANDAASPAPWLIHVRPNESMFVGSDRAQITVSDDDPVYPIAPPQRDVRLFVLLRNAAPEIAALVEAAALVIKHRWPREGHLQPSLEQLESALADLDAKVKP